MRLFLSIFFLAFSHLVFSRPLTIKVIDDTKKGLGGATVTLTFIVEKKHYKYPDKIVTPESGQIQIDITYNRFVVCEIYASKNGHLTYSGRKQLDTYLEIELADITSPLVNKTEEIAGNAQHRRDKVIDNHKNVELTAQQVADIELINEELNRKDQELQKLKFDISTKYISTEDANRRIGEIEGFYRMKIFDLEEKYKNIIYKLQGQVSKQDSIIIAQQEKIHVAYMKIKENSCNCDAYEKNKIKISFYLVDENGNYLNTSYERLRIEVHKLPSVKGDNGKMYPLIHTSGRTHYDFDIVPSNQSNKPIEVIFTAKDDVFKSGSNNYYIFIYHRSFDKPLNSPYFEISSLSDQCKPRA
jgi:hypothetical protein